MKKENKETEFSENVFRENNSMGQNNVENKQPEEQLNGFLQGVIRSTIGWVCTLPCEPIRYSDEKLHFFLPIFLFSYVNDCVSMHLL